MEVNLELTGLKRMIHGIVISKNEFENFTLNQYLQGSDILRQTKKSINGTTKGLKVH